MMLWWLLRNLFYEHFASFSGLLAFCFGPCDVDIKLRMFNQAERFIFIDISRQAQWKGNNDTGTGFYTAWTDTYLLFIFFICPYSRFLVDLVLVAESDMGKFTPASAAG